MSLALYDIDTAPEPANKELELSLKAFGFIPNLHKVLAGAPQVLAAYKNLHAMFQDTSFDNTELTVVWQTINYYHQCHYCLPAHTGIAHMMKINTDIIDALSKGEPLKDEKLGILQATTRAMVDQRGHLTTDQISAFKAAGYGEQQLLEIVLGLAQKTISNYANHLADTPVDTAFQGYVK